MEIVVALIQHSYTITTSQQINQLEKIMTTQPTLPPHLVEALRKYEEKIAKFGLIDLSKLDRSKYDDNHPIHAMATF